MSVYAEDPGDSDRPELCCASWSAAPMPGTDSCDADATELVDGDPFCAKHAKEARDERLKNDESALPASFQERRPALPAPKAPCGCEWVSCDPCGKLVPKHDVVNLSAEQSGAAQCDTTACSACRGAEPDETCETCGSCDVCDCADKAILRASLLVGERLDAEPMPGNTPDDRLRMQADMEIEDDGR